MNMLDFMIIGLPRSGTTWAANWLTTDTLHCLHDPLYTTHYSDWDTKLVIPGRATGVSCTGIWRWTDWLNQHPAHKVLLHRDLGEIADSMRAIGLPTLDLEAGEQLLQSVEGYHVDYADLFDPDVAETIWTYLTGQPFNKERHRELVNIEMQPKFSGLSVGPEVTRRLLEELSRMAGGW